MKQEKINLLADIKSGTDTWNGMLSTALISEATQSRYLTDLIDKDIVEKDYSSKRDVMFYRIKELDTDTEKKVDKELEERSDLPDEFEFTTEDFEETLEKFRKRIRAGENEDIEGELRINS